MKDIWKYLDFKEDMKTLILFIIAGFFVGCSNAPKVVVQEVKEDSKSSSAQELFIKGNAHLEAKEWKEAIDVYKQAENLETRWDLLLNRGIAEIQMGDFNAALNSFSEALNNGGDKEAIVYFNLGNLYQERGLYQDAVNAYRAGLVYVPAGTTDVDMITNLGAAYVFLRQWEDANETYEFLRTKAPNDPAALHGLGMVHQMKGNFDQAIEKYSAVSASFPEFAMSHYTRAQCLGSQKKYAEAIAAYKEYKRLFPDSNYINRINAIIQRYEEKVK